jgi:hypothetical protein
MPLLFSTSFIHTLRADRARIFALRPSANAITARGAE